MKEKLRTPLCDLLDIKYPIIQAGMGILNPFIPQVATSPELVAAVSNAGGLGVLGLTATDVDEAVDYVRRTKKLTSEPFGVDLIFPAAVGAIDTDAASKLMEKIPGQYKELVEKIRVEYEIPKVEWEPTFIMTMMDLDLNKRKLDAIVEEKVPVIVSAFGTPSFVLEQCRAHGIKLISAVGNLKTAVRTAELKVDAIVIEGWGAASHSGRIDTFVLIPEVVDAIKPVPVIAAGGISIGRQIAGSLMLGAAGVWMGTRFLATPEAAVPDWYKELIVKAGDEDTAKNEYWTGKMNRHLRSPIDKALETSGLKPLPMPTQMLLTMDIIGGAIVAGKYELASQLMGQGTSLINQIKPAKEVMEELIKEAAEALGA